MVFTNNENCTVLIWEPNKKLRKLPHVMQGNFLENIIPNVDDHIIFNQQTYEIIEILSSIKSKITGKKFYKLIVKLTEN